MKRFNRVHRLIQYTALLSVLLLSGLAQARETLTITMPKKHIVASEEIYQVTLGALAQSFQTKGATPSAKLTNLVITETPKPGEEKLSSQNHVLRSIRAAQLPFTHIRFDGPTTFPIYGPGQAIPMERMVQEIEDYLLAQSGWPRDELVMRIISAPEDGVWLPPGEVDIAVTSVNNYLHGTRRYEMQFFIDQLLVDKAPFIVSVFHRRKIYVPLQNMERGEVIGPDSIIERYVEIDNPKEDEQLVGRYEDLVGQRARTDLHAHQPIKQHQLETNYILRRGDRVELIVKHNGLTMQTAATMLKRAAPGQVVPIKAATTGQVVKGRVLNRDQVLLVGR